MSEKSSPYFAPYVKNNYKRFKVETDSSNEVVVLEDGQYSTDLPDTPLQHKSLFVKSASILSDNEDSMISSDIPSESQITTPSPELAHSKKISLSDEQNNIIKLASEGHNIFYTGSAGTGKSILLRELISELKMIHGSDKVAVTASTGLAACNIGGITAHSFAGIGLGAGDPDSLVNKVKRSKRHRDRWQTIKTLIIDEISMIDSELLDKLDYIAQKIRKNRNPFGNIQLIFCGDFFQLPPVTRGNATKYAFESELWKTAFKISIKLEKVFRQQGDLIFIDMLNKLRMGYIDQNTEIEFQKLARPLIQDDIIPAELYCTRNEVDKANNSRLNSLSGQLFIFNAIDGGTLKDADMREKLLQNFMAPKCLSLKVGAQVMMIKNVDETLVNGSLGKVIAFVDHDTFAFYDTVLKNSGNMTVQELEQYKGNIELLTARVLRDPSEGTEQPIRNKISKDEFCRYDPNVSDTDVEELFNILQDTAVSFGNSDDTPEVIDLKKNIFIILQKSTNGQRKLPLVNFKTSDLSNRLVLVEPEDWAIEDEKEVSLVSRVQLPLMLAWSLSIHKSQGQTLPKLKVDLKRVFEKGQTYVALSRAVSRDGLQVLNFDRKKIETHKKVVDFYTTLISTQDALIKYSKEKKEVIKPNITPIAMMLSKKTTSPRTPSSRSTSSRTGGGIIAMLQKRGAVNKSPNSILRR